MISWGSVFSNSLWLSGLALVLAVSSYSAYTGAERRLPARARWQTVVRSGWTRIGGLLVCVGMVLTSPGWIESVLWSLLGLFVLYEWWTRRNVAEPSQPTPNIEKESPVRGSFPRLRALAEWLVKTELLWLALLSPVFLFPAPPYAVALLAVPVLWGARWLARNRLLPPTPFDWILAPLALMTLVSLYATFDIGFSAAKVTGVIFGVALFYAIIEWSAGGGRLRWTLAGYTLLGTVLAGVGLLGTDWVSKLPVLRQVGEQLPSFIRGLPGAEGGIHPNELGGALLWVAPMQLSLLWWSFTSGRKVSRAWWALRIGLLIATTVTTGTLLLTQSRSAYSGFAMALALLVILALRHFRWVLAAILLLGVGLALYIGPQQIADRLMDAYSPGAGTTGSLSTLGGRAEIWSRALYGIEDFPITGMGMNTFRRVMPVLYPTTPIASNDALIEDVGHAHNHFLQAALDLGLPGLVAYLAIWLLVPALAVQAWRSSRDKLIRATVAGAGAGLLAYFVYGITDTVALGAKPGFFFWALLALLVVLWQRSRAEERQRASVRAEAIEERGEEAKREIEQAQPALVKM
ncbi:MAG TPA: O-antigen ligase family protein [Chloroflexia bacterium]|nr:O-antigen ligase family protein [Chloroflexia bacterium]